jgi:hypothetical protein
MLVVSTEKKSSSEISWGGVQLLSPCTPELKDRGDISLLLEGNK